MTRKSATIVEIAVLTAIWGATIAIINPRGDFPLLDDWDFAIATRNFAQSGHFHFTQFTVVSLRAMVLWGAAWIRLFGDSFNVLRASTLTLSLGAILVVDRTLARARIARGARMLASLALLFNPIFLWTSCTYMTDVPYVFASAVAFYFFFRGLDEDRVAFIVAGVLSVMVSWFIRQNGLINILPMMPLAVMKRRRSFVVVGTCVIALYALLFVFKRDWLSGAPEMFAVHFHMWGESSFRLPEQVAVFAHYTVFNAQNSAVFFLPLTLPLLFAWRRLSRRETIGVALLAAIVFWRVGDLAVNGYLFPYTTHAMYSDILPGNLVMGGGVGAPMLFDTFNLGYDYPFGIPWSARVALTIASAILAISLLAWLCLRPRPSTEELPAPEEMLRVLLVRMALALAATGTLALFASGYYFDRYSLDSAWSVVLVLPAIVPWSKRGAKIAAIVALASVAVVSTLAVQESFIWNRARWQAWSDLRAHGVAVTQIEGGGDLFGLFELADAPRAVARSGHPPREFVITFRPLGGYRVMARYPFDSFLGTRHGAIYALRKAGAVPVSGTSY